MACWCQLPIITGHMPPCIFSKHASQKKKKKVNKWTISLYTNKQGICIYFSGEGKAHAMFIYSPTKTYRPLKGAHKHVLNHRFLVWDMQLQGKEGKCYRTSSIFLKSIAMFPFSLISGVREKEIVIIKFSLLQISSSHFYMVQLWSLLLPIHLAISTKSSNENFIVHP